MSDLKRQRMEAMKARVQAALAETKPEESEEETQQRQGMVEGDEEGAEDGEAEKEEEGDEDEEDEDNAKSYSWHFDMLNDTERNEQYEKAIQNAVKKVSKTKKSPVGLDIGTGSGLLAMMARRAGCGKVWAIEADPTLVQVAQDNIVANQLSNVEVLCGHSSTLEIKDKADIFVSELLDSGLLGEDFLPTLRDAQKRFLSKNAIVLPAAARVFARLVQSPSLHSWQHMNASVLGCKLPKDIRNDPGPASPSAVHITPLITAGLASYLSDPFLVFSFDFQHPPSEDGRCKRVNVDITNSGSVHAVVFWWECILIDDINLTNSPSSEAKREHWSQAVYVVQNPLQVKERQSLRVLATHNDLDIWFPLLYVREEGENEEECEKETDGAPPMHESISGLHDTYDTDRLWSFFDSARLSLYRTALRKVATKHKNGPILSIEDGPLLAVIAAQEGATAVKSLQNSQDNLLLTKAFLKANGLHKKVETSRNLASLMEDTEEKVAPVVCAEPYFQGNGTWASEACMQFSYKVSKLKPYLSQDPVIMPARAHVMGALVECPSLFARKQRVQDVCGFDLRKFNRLHEGDCLISEQIWRHEHKVLSAPFNLLELDFCHLRSHALSLAVDVLHSGSLHALVLWIDFVVDPEDPSSLWSTGCIASHAQSPPPAESALPKTKKRNRAKNKQTFDTWSFPPTCWYQGARILQQVQGVSPGTKVKVSVQFNSDAFSLDAKIS